VNYDNEVIYKRGMAEVVSSVRGSTLIFDGTVWSFGIRNNIISILVEVQNCE
jgi:hypothetical protein